MHLKLSNSHIEDATYTDADFAAYLKPSYATSSPKPSVGILLTNIGFANNTNLTIGTTTGTSTNTNATIFDNLAIGIKAESTGVNVRNCSFQKGWVRTPYNNTKAY